jgi:glucokinase
MPKSLPTPLKYNADMNRIAIGADIGGSHITCQLYVLNTNKLVEGTRIRQPVDCHAEKEVLLEAWKSALSNAARGFDFSLLAGVGFAMPGPFDYPAGVAWFEGVQKYESLYGVNVRREILDHFNLPDEFPVRFLNDASCFAIGESFLGGASDMKRFLTITLGTGFGTTFINDHLPVAGEDGVPPDGFLYHIPYGESIADDNFSTRWFQKVYLEKTGKKLTGVKELVELAKTETTAQDIFKTFGKNMGAFLAPWLRDFRAEGLVIGGNISAAHSLFLNELKLEFEKALLKIRVVVSALQEDAALSGSASLCDNALYSRLISKNL